jgi:hypothetical protein
MIDNNYSWTHELLLELDELGVVSPYFVKISQINAADC